MRFLGPGADGKVGGIFSKIDKNILHQTIRIRHLHMIHDRVIATDTTWEGMYEIYSFESRANETIVKVELDIDSTWVSYMQPSWPRALARLKMLCEKPAKITVHVVVDTSRETAWDYLTNPLHIPHWAFASDDWMCPTAIQDLTVGGRFMTRMSSKDGKHSFDFEGTYTHIDLFNSYTYIMDDGREAVVTLYDQNGKVMIQTVFEAESENSTDMQREGWQAIAENLKKYIIRLSDKAQ
jgi:uncharacterized protein YndB with AHSA1/START domain